MSYIFLDESGDLGFNFDKLKTTKYFIITFLFIDRKRPIEKIIRSVHASLRKKYKMRDGTIHAYKEEPSTCTRVCRKLAENHIKVMTIYLNKKKVFTKLQNEKAVLYNYVTNILIDRIMSKRLVNKKEAIFLIASRRETNKFLNLNFKNYLENQVAANHNINLTIEIKTPSEEKGLQAVDMLSWAIFRKYEYGDDSYYNIIKDVIIEENPLFP
jgi:hypothetical protein